MFDLEDLQTFAAVADAGGITPGARRLGLSKSIVSRRLARLEHDLGAQLLVRTTRGAALTDVGMTFREHAVRVVAELDEARDAISAAGDLRGTLRVTAPLSFGPTHLAPVFAEFALAHPRLQMQASYSDSLVNIVSEGYDAAVRIGFLSDSTLVARRICDVGGRFVASPGYVERHGVPKTVDEIAEHEALLLRTDAWPITVRGKLVRVQPRGRFQTDNGVALLWAVLAGVGIAMLPDFLVEEHLRAGALVSFLEGHEPPPVPMHVVRPPGARTSRKVSMLIDLMAQRFAHGLAAGGNA